MKKSISVILCLALLLSLASFEGLAEEPVTITLLQRLPATYIVDDNPVLKELEKMLNIKLEIEAPPISNFDERRNIIMASGELPDVLYVGDLGAQYSQWAQDGLFLDLTSYLNAETMPHASSVLTKEELSFVDVPELGGGIYSLPRVQTKPMDCIIYRKDWLDRLNLEVPTTPEEFAAVMHAFAHNDPDGNGKDDTYGWSVNPGAGKMASQLINAFGIRPSEVPDAEGKYAVAQRQEAYMEYLDWLRGMYMDGSLDPEYYLIKNYEDREKFQANKIGAVYATITVEHLLVLKNSDDWVDKNFELAVGPCLRAEGAEVSDVYYPPQIWGNYAINADCEHIDEAVKFLDACYSDEVNELLMFGVEGITYSEFNHDGHYAIKTEEQMNNTQKYCASYATFNYQCEDKGLLIANGNTLEDIELFNTTNNLLAAQTNRISYLPGFGLPGLSDEMVKAEDSGINDQFGEKQTMYICGKLDRDEIVEFLQVDYANAYKGTEEIYEENGINK